MQHQVHSAQGTQYCRTCAITPKQADMRKATAKTTTEGVGGWSGGGASGLPRASSAGPMRRWACDHAKPLGRSWFGAAPWKGVAQQGGIVPIQEAVVVIHEAKTHAMQARLLLLVHSTDQVTVLVLLGWLETTPPLANIIQLTIECIYVYVCDES